MAVWFAGLKEDFIKCFITKNRWKYIVIGLGNTLNGFGGRFNLLCATLLMYALGRIHGKKETLKKERRLHE